MELQKRTLKDWVIATRPWSAPASVIPVFFSLAYLFFISHQEGLEVNWLNAWLCLPMLVILHFGGNLVSDYYDNINKVDLPGSLNGVRSMESGKFKPKEILFYGYALLGIGAVIGLFIVWNSSVEVLWIGALALILPLGYPWLKAHALGDLDILLCFALLPSIGVAFVATEAYHPELLLYCLPYGLLTVAILHANNTRDIRNDHRAGLETFPRLTGGKAAQYVYTAELTLPYVMLVVFAVCGWLPMWLLIGFLTLPIAVKNIRTMLKARPEEELDIATLDQTTAQLQLSFGLLYALSLVIAGLFI
jgi:1,4-dihydroxy-2-naphthoate octaprenyltransferase